MSTCSTSEIVYSPAVTGGTCSDLLPLPGRCFSLNLWGVPKGNEDLLNPLGSTGINPNSDSPNLTLEFETGAHPIVFPNREQITEFADFLTRLDQQESQGQVRLIH